jgi:hypothetical protein
MADTKATEGFAGLLTQLDKMGTVSKSMAAADGGKPDDEAAARILAAAAEGKEGEGKEGKEGEGAEGEGEGDGLMGKSFRVKLADGTETDAFDGTEMMKALAVKIEAQDVVAGDFAKAMTAMVDIVNTAQTVIVEQGKLIKSLQADVQRGHRPARAGEHPRQAHHDGRRRGGEALHERDDGEVLHRAEQGLAQRHGYRARRGPPEHRPSCSGRCRPGHRLIPP